MIYFIEAIGSGFVKIGRASDPRIRLAGLSAGSPYPLQIIGVIDGPNQLEGDLHVLHRSSRHYQEWFRKTPAVMEYISKHAVPIEPYKRATRHKREADVASHPYCKTMNCHQCGKDFLRIQRPADPKPRRRFCSRDCQFGYQKGTPQKEQLACTSPSHSSDTGA